MALLFDLDGTLLDTALDFVHVINTLRSNKNMSIIDDRSEVQNIRLAVSHGIESLIQTGFGISKDHPDFLELQKDILSLYQQNINKYTQPFPGILELLQTLDQRKIPWGVVTNKPGFLTDPLLESMKWAKHAACIVSGDTTPYPKPHPDPLLYACQKIKISPEQCIYIGDAERDIQAGKAAGMATIVALFGYIEDFSEARLWEADHYVHHADEILPWVDQRWQR